MTEKDLKNLGFKKRWLTDKSGFWFEKQVRFLELEGKLIIELDNKFCNLDIQTYKSTASTKLIKSNFETVLKIKCDLKSIKQALKRYDK